MYTDEELGYAPPTTAISEEIGYLPPTEIKAGDIVVNIAAEVLANKLGTQSFLRKFEVVKTYQLEMWEDGPNQLMILQYVDNDGNVQSIRDEFIVEYRKVG